MRAKVNQFYIIASTSSPSVLKTLDVINSKKYFYLHNTERTRVLLVFGISCWCYDSAFKPETLSLLLNQDEVCSHHLSYDT